MIDCNICKHKEDYCIGCKHGELFERKNVSEPKKISVSNGNEYCGHCGYYQGKNKTLTRNDVLKIVENIKNYKKI